MNNNEHKSFSDFMSVLLKWKKFLLINLFLIVAVTAVITLLIDNEYKSQATVIIASSSSDAGLTGMFSDVTSLLGLGKPSAGNEEYLLGILGSRELKESMIKKFHLADYYDITKYRMDKTIKKLETEYFFELNENGMIDISFIHKNPETAKEIVQFVINFADSVNRKLHKEKARNYREFIETRYDKVKEDLRSAEEKLKNFQAKTGLYVIPDQIMANIDVMVELEKNLYMKKLELDVLKSNPSPNQAVIKQIKREINVYKKNLDKIKQGNSADKSLAFLPTEKLPEMYSEYIRIYRDFEIQNKILETLTPIYEQALMDEQKNTPTLMVLDPPFVPELKDSPKRAAIVVIVFLLSLFVLIPLVLFGESVVTKKERNLFEEKMNVFYQRIINIYRMKF